MFNAVLEVNFSETQTAGSDVGNASVVSYEGAGGERAFTKTALIDSEPLLVFRDGIKWDIVDPDDGYGSGRTCSIDTDTGIVTFNASLPAFEDGETSSVLYLPNGGVADITEPVTLQQAKDWLKVETDADDDLITSLISAARLWCEKYSNKSLVERTITAVLRNELGGIFLPYGPFGEVVSAVDEDDNDISDSVTIKGGTFPWLKEPCSDYIKIVYTAGYSVCPELFKTAIKRQVAYMYENRGNEQKPQELGASAIELLSQVRDVV